MWLLVMVLLNLSCSGGPQIVVASGDDVDPEEEPVADEGAGEPTVEVDEPIVPATSDGPRIEITRAGMSINGELLPAQPTFEQFVRHFGQPSRSSPRANIVHIFDELGIVMLQPHNRAEIIEVSFYYGRMQVDFQPESLFNGTVSLMGEVLNGAWHVQELRGRFPMLSFDTEYTLSAVVNPSVEVFFRERPAGDKLGRISVDFPH